MQNLRRIKNPFLLFLPFLIIYVAFVLVMYSHTNGGDEPRYFRFAKNLLKGFYSEKSPNIDLTNGPGYPLLLVPFVFFHLSKIYIVLLNAVLHYLSVVFVFKTLIQYVTFKKALIFSVLWACYYMAYQNMPNATTETLTIFLISVLFFAIAKAYELGELAKSKKYIIISGILLGYIVLTKVIFGYVVLCMLISIFLLWIFNRKVVNYKKSMIVLIIAFVTFTPYLFYTYHLTGRYFFMGTASDALYWMSSPYKGEYGDWKGDLKQNPVELGNYNIPGAGDTLLAHHQKDFEEVYSLKNGLKQSDLFQEKAIENIKTNPLKYGQNIFFNLGRIFFHYPFSYAVQRPKSLLAMPINGIIFTFILLCLIPTILFWRKISFPIRFMLFMGFLYLGASSLVSAETRMLTIVVPILIIWFGYIIHKIVKINPGKEF